MANRRHRNIDLSIPASKHPIPVSRLVELLFEALAKKSPESQRIHSRPMRVRYNAYNSIIRKFHEFLTATKKAEVTIDEDLIRDFVTYSVKTGTPDSYLGNLRNEIRKLINLLPIGLLQRELISLADVDKANRFSCYTKRTQDAFEDFLKNGRKLKTRTTHKDPQLSNELLSPLFRKQIIDGTLTFMRSIEANDIFALTEDDVEEFLDYYEENDKRTIGQNLLGYIRPIFSYLRVKGLLKEDILADIPRRQWSSNLDYVDKEGVDKLEDLSTLNMDDFVDVRGRLLAFGLDYVYALRNMESSLVRCSNFNGLNIHLPKEIQKIKKDTLPLFCYFPTTTGILLKRYLELRAMKSPDTDILIISCDGRPLKADGCRQAVKEHCIKLGIKTTAGKVVTPHRLRHSLGILNVDVLGRELGIMEIRDHYRHANIETTVELYMTKNPLYKKIVYEKRMQKINALEGNVVQFSPPPSINTPPVPPIQDAFIDENKALQQVRSLGLNDRSLRKYALADGKAQKNGKGFMYSSAFIADLASNYFTRAEAIDLLKFKPSTFYDWTKKDGVEFILIGQVSLFRKEIILEKRRSA